MATDEERNRRLAERVLQESAEVERRQRESARREKQASDDSERITLDIQNALRDTTTPKDK